MVAALDWTRATDSSQNRRPVEVFRPPNVDDGGDDVTVIGRCHRDEFAAAAGATPPLSC